MLVFSKKLQINIPKSNIMNLILFTTYVTMRYKINCILIQFIIIIIIIILYITITSEV